MDWVVGIIQAATAIAMVFATIFIVYYAKVTIDEGKKNRRKDTIERTLENVYSRLYEVFRRALFERSLHDKEEAERAIQRWKRGTGGASKDVFLSGQEFDSVSSIVERFGHYMDSTEQAKLPKMLQRSDLGVVSPPVRYYFFERSDLEVVFKDIMKKREHLRGELKDLTTA